MEETKTVHVEFDELAKSVTAKVRVEISNCTDSKSVLAEAKELFEEASKYSHIKTLNKALNR